MLNTSLLELLHFLGGGVCHQLPERSLHVAGTVTPLCARCTGTFIGAAAGLLVVVLLRRLRASLLPRWPMLAIFAAFFLAWGLDGLNSYLTLFPGLPHLYEPNNTLRLITGTLEGLALSLILWPVVASALWAKPEPTLAIHYRELFVTALAAVAFAALLATEPSALVYAGALVSVLGMLAIFGLLNALLLAVILHREATISSRRQAAAMLAGVLLLGAAELTLLSLLRHWLLGF